MRILKRYEEVINTNIQELINSGSKTDHELKLLMLDYKDILNRINGDMYRATAIEKKDQKFLGNCMVELERDKDNEDLKKEKDRLQEIFNKSKDNTNKMKEMKEKLEKDIALLENR